MPSLNTSERAAAVAACRAVTSGWGHSGWAALRQHVWHAQHGQHAAAACAAAAGHPRRTSGPHLPWRSSQTAGSRWRTGRLKLFHTRRPTRTKTCLRSQEHAKCVSVRSMRWHTYTAPHRHAIARPARSAQPGTTAQQGPRHPRRAPARKAPYAAPASSRICTTTSRLMRLPCLTRTCGCGRQGGSGCERGRHGGGPAGARQAQRPPALSAAGQPAGTPCARPKPHIAHIAHHIETQPYE